MEETVKSALPSLPRNDLLSDGRPRSTEPLPTQRFTAQPQPRRRRSKYNLGGVGYNNIGTSVGAYPGEQIDTPRETKKYREWREDMIFDKTTGKMVPKLVYPSVAPEMPPHIAAILAARMQCSSHRFATS